MSICTDEESKVKFTKLKYCRRQYAHRKKARENIQNCNTADVNIHRRKKQSKIYGTEILQMSISTDDKSKVKYTEVQYCRSKIPIYKEEGSKVRYKELEYCTY